MSAQRKKTEFVTFSPELRADDPCANYWLHQVTLRLRREVAWIWQERGVKQSEGPAPLPPFSDRVSTTLDMSRFWAEKQNFYLTDPTARYLTEKLETKSPKEAYERSAQGSFGWVANSLDLADVSQFVLALALTVALDGSMGSVIATCSNDPAKIYPTLALAQKLWDEPNDVLRVADPFHPLFRNGLVAYVNRSGHYQTETGWDAPFSTPSLVASQLLYPTKQLPQGLVSLVTENGNDKLSETEHIVSLRLRTEGSDGLRVVPVVGARGSSRREAVQAIASANQKQLCEFKGDAALLSDQQYLNSLATICWLRDSYLFFSSDLPSAAAGEKPRTDALTLPSHTIPAIVFLAAEERNQLASLSQHLTLPAVNVPPSTYLERRDFWKQNLGAKARGLDKLIAECARRFRFEKATILAICEELKQLPGKVSEEEFVAACRAEVESDIGELAGRVSPRFDKEDLVLPHKQHLQFEEILSAMRALTEVHYSWGTGKVWNEAGISVLFAGPPGTGKTMAAEILAVKLDLPMYRIDLSQVVNKYIGETEKNLKRVFDAADVSDIILFFDEADSLFGRRTEVSDAHDRYANLEISYLLERMERFKGLAILATNRKKDLDEAFLRRLRYVVDFPLPDVAERKRIWRQVIPERADSSQLDLDFLAHQFPLAGGNIRSIVFNACLQSANGSSANGTAGTLSMDEVIVAIKREYDKLNRTLSLEQYGAHASLVEGLEHEQEKRTH